MAIDNGIVVSTPTFQARVDSIATLTLEVIHAQIGAVAAVEALDKRYTRAVLLNIFARYAMACDRPAREEFLRALARLTEAVNQDRERPQG